MHQKQTAPKGRLFIQSDVNRLERLDSRSLLALRALLDFEAHLLVFLKRLEALRLDLGEMSEQILTTIIRRDETETLCIVEPLNSTCCHLSKSH
jgi:hypothetical protein